MRLFEVILLGRLVNHDGSPLPAGEWTITLDKVAVELPHATAVDGIISGNAVEETLSIHVVVDAPTLEQAIVVGGGQIRTALHAAGVGTPGWDNRTLKYRVADFQGSGKELVSAPV